MLFVGCGGGEVEREANGCSNDPNRHGNVDKAESAQVSAIVLYFLSINNISPFVHCCAVAGGRKEDAAVADGSSAHEDEAKEANAVMRPLRRRVSAGIVYLTFAFKND